MNFGIIGYGTIAKTHAQVIENLTEAKLAAIATRTPEKARMAGAKHGCDFYTDYRELLKQGIPPAITSQEGLTSVKLITGIYESSRKNEWVQIS